MIENVFEGPWQDTEPLVNVGVTTIVASTGANPELEAVNAPIFPVPLAARPIPGVSFVQL